MAKAGLSPRAIISDSEPDDMTSPAIGSRRRISPPILTRESSALGQTELASQPPTNQEAKTSDPSSWPAGATTNAAHDDTNTSLARPLSANQKTPRNQTPKKGEVTLAKLESSLRDFSREIGVNHANLTARLIYDAWKNDAPQQRLISEKDWFAGMKLEPVGATNKPSEGMRIKTKVSTVLRLKKTSRNT